MEYFHSSEWDDIGGCMHVEKMVTQGIEDEKRKNFHSPPVFSFPPILYEVKLIILPAQFHAYSVNLFSIYITQYDTALWASFLFALCISFRGGMEIIDINVNVIDLFMMRELFFMN